MAKDPAFLFYSSDFLTGTMLMTDEQVGKYIRLLCLQHQKGTLTEKDMLKICLTQDEDIYNKFIKVDTGYINQRLFEETEKRKKYSESRANNRKGSKKDKKDMNNICNSYDSHMENENENVIISNNSYIDIGEILKIFLAEQSWKERIGMNYKMDIDKIDLAINVFCTEQELKGCEKKSKFEWQSHFINWLKLNLETYKRPEQKVKTRYNRTYEDMEVKE